jgi:hypothetical protein
MNKQVLYCAPLEWTGLTQSTSLVFLSTMNYLIVFRIKDKLRSGELAVSGDQWPHFLYQGYHYDRDDPWKGLFRSAILVSVSFDFSLCVCIWLTG